MKALLIACLVSALAMLAPSCTTKHHKGDGHDHSGHDHSGHNHAHGDGHAH